jgi:hypothetical protein
MHACSEAMRRSCGAGIEAVEAVEFASLTDQC